MRHKRWWNRAFCAGSLLAALAQGYMLGLLVVGLERSPAHVAFAAFIAVALAAGYCLLGAGWLIMKTGGALQGAAVRWARRSLWLTAAGIFAVSVATPLVNPTIRARWFSLPEFILLAPIPVFTVLLFTLNAMLLHRLPGELTQGRERWTWAPFALSAGIFVLAFNGLVYSLYPWLVPGRIDVWQAAAAPGSLRFILFGVALMLPLIVAYTVYVYRVFRGKTAESGY